MSLTAHERRDLCAIKDELADSDYRLFSLLTTFNRLAQDEEMPIRERLPDRDLSPAARWLHPDRPGQNNRLPAMIVSLAVTFLLATVIAIMLAVKGAPDPCPDQWLSPIVPSVHGQVSCAAAHQSRQSRQSQDPTPGTQALVPGE
jgi:hypothetical protein